METALQNLLANRKVRFGIRYLTHDGILDQELDADGCPWSVENFPTALSKAKQVLARDDVKEVQVSVEFVMERLRK